MAMDSLMHHLHLPITLVGILIVAEHRAVVCDFNCVPVRTVSI